MGGCVKEDMSDCVSGKLISFESIMQKYEYGDFVESVDLFLYNQSDALTARYTYRRSELIGNDYMALLPMQPYGTYTAVAVINLSDDYSITGAETKNTFRVCLDADSGSKVQHKQADIYQGFNDNIVFSSSTEQVQEYDDIVLWKNTNHFYVDIDYSVYQIPANHTLAVHIEGNNGETDFRNYAPVNCFRFYEPHQQTYPTNFNLTTMKLWVEPENTPNTDLKLVLTLTDDTGIDPPVVRTAEIFKILKNYPVTRAATRGYDTGDKLSQQDEFIVNIKLGAGFIIFSINNVEWSKIDNPPIIIG